MAKKSSGTGQGGKSLQDRELAARVRRLTLSECEKQLLKGKGKLYEAVLLRLAGSVIPRLMEHSGPDGAPLILPATLIEKNDTAPDTGTSGAEPTPV